MLNDLDKGIRRSRAMTKDIITGPEADIVRSIETTNAIIRKRSDGILMLHHPMHVVESTLSHVKENFEALCEIQAGEISPFLMHTGQVHKISAESKAFMTKSLGSIATHMAMVTDHSNPLSILAVRMYMYLHRPSIPTRVFRQDPHAIIWLRTQMS